MKPEVAEKKKKSSKGLIAFSSGLLLWQILFWWVTELGNPTRQDFTYFGAPYATEIYAGHFWGIITNSLLHVDIIHFLFNFALLFLFARRIERSYGTSFFLYFGFVLSVATSALQLAVSGDAGIGLSSVNLGFLFFMIGDPKSYWKWSWFQPTAITIGICFLLFAFINVFTKWLPLGLGASISGILVGYFTGKFYHLRKELLVLSFSVLSLSFISLAYNPFSSEWNTFQGYKAYNANKTDRARNFYLRAIELSDKNVIAKKSLNMIKIDSISNIAYDLHNNKKYKEAKSKYLEILELDSTNSWAKENLEIIPE